MPGLLLALLSSTLVDAAVFHMELINVHPPPSNITRRQMIQFHIKQRHQQRMQFNMLRAYSRLFQQPLIPSYSNLFLAHVTIGTPPQQFSVVTDTGSSEFWVPDITCTDFKPGTRTFNSSAPSTYRPDGTPMNVSYVDKSEVIGFFGIDTVKLGGSERLIIPEQSIGQATRLHLTSSPTNTVFDGIMGLSFPIPRLHKSPIISPILNAFNQSLLDEPIFTIWLPPMTGVRGLITYGAIDQQHYGNITYEPLIEEQFWVIKVSRVGVGRNYLSKTYKSLLDTGAETIAGRYSTVNWIAARLNGTWDMGTRAYIVECSQKKPIVFTIAGKKHKIEPDNYVHEVTEGVCELRLTPLDSPSFDTLFVLGVPFIRQRCIVFDYANMQIGFSNEK